jgi:hypothetical protein
VRFRKRELIREGGRNVVWRAWTEGEGSVVVKELKPGETLGLLDWACLRFLSEAAPGVAPCLTAEDYGGRAFGMEDLGGSRTLAEVLREGDERALADVCAAMASAYARLHAATRHSAHEQRFLETCRALPGAVPHERSVEADRWLAGLTRVREWLSAAGSAPVAGFEDAVRRVAARYRDPGEWLAFTHGDPAPSNTHVSESGEVRLLDFEYGGFRHALYDLTAWWMLCPLPEAAARTVRRTYRAALANALTAAQDEVQFSREWALLSAFRGLAIISWLPLSVLQRDYEWVPGWSARARLLATAARLGAIRAGVADLGPVAETAAQLEDGLARLWPEQRGVLPVW